jgi:hypothetical protein
MAANTGLRSGRQLPRRDHLPDKPISLGFVVQVLGKYGFLPLSRVNLQIMVDRMAGISADIRGDAFDLTCLEVFFRFEG